MRFEADLEKLLHADLWGDSTPVERVEDFYSVVVDGGAGRSGGPERVPTHVFGDRVELVPYHDQDEGVADAAGGAAGRGDGCLAQVFGPGEIGFQVKNRRPQNRLLRATDDEDEMKQHLKLQDTHVGLMVGVEDRAGAPGVVSLHNPQAYDKGRFGRDEAGYSMLLLRPRFPAYAAPEVVDGLTANIRTMMVGFNTLSHYPKENYDGADPLGACDVESVREHARQMVMAIGGDPEEVAAARAWFARDENLIYCSELAHVSASTGLHCPLNAKTFVPIVGGDVWERFVGFVGAHNAGEVTPFTQGNHNPLVKHIGLALADEGLEPLPAYAPEGARAGGESGKLSFRPLSGPGLVAHAVAVLGGDGQDPVGFVREFCPAFVAQFDERPGAGSPGGGETLYVPPSLLHLVAMGRHDGGLLGLDYVGHGLHFSLVRRVD